MPQTLLSDEERLKRVVINEVTPMIDGGRYPVKRVVGEWVEVEANVFADGHDLVAACLLYRHGREGEWRKVPMVALGNDRWRGKFKVSQLGIYCYTVEGWVDHFSTWVFNLRRRVEAGVAEEVDLLIGKGLLVEVMERVKEGKSQSDIRRLERAIRAIEEIKLPLELKEVAHLEGLVRLAQRLIRRYPEPSQVTRYPVELQVRVEPRRARFSAWYELFPRSWSREPGRHGTFQDLIHHLPYIAEMGFDVLYLPPIHPIGRSRRKGRNNSLEPEADAPGSPWAIGSEEGGHKAVHPQLGTLDDFRQLVKVARYEYGIEVALDLAFHCSPDHLYLKEHPEWFFRRPDGSLQYAENPPKKYQDIYPFYFETPEWKSLWTELYSIVEFWTDQGVKIFRVDNPHTKPFPFWEWLIQKLKNHYPDVILLSEAFTRPQVMHQLAKLGFTQSYTYFTWRNTKWEIESYLEELCQHPSREYFIPNLWPNTPDILHEYLQSGGRPAFITRLVLAATAGSNYGIYGPAFELCVNTPLKPGSEEYLNSEKYEIKHWDLEAPHSLKPLITLVNRIRKENEALHHTWSLKIYRIDNPLLIVYGKRSPDKKNIILVALNLDTHYTQSGWVEIPVEDLGVSLDQEFWVHDLLTGNRYPWKGTHHYIELNPHHLPAHIFRVERA